MGQPSSKLRRSTPADVKEHLSWACEQLAAWEDQASMVKELLATSVSEPGEALAAVNAPWSEQYTLKLSSGPSGAGAHLPSATPAAPASITPTAAATASGEKAPEFNGAAIRHLLYNVDEVLRHSEAHEYFKGIPQDKLERIMTARESAFVLPPQANGEPLESASDSFALAAMASVLRHEQDKGRPSGEAEADSAHLASLRHKRSQSELYGARTPVTSPVPPESRDVEHAQMQQRAAQQSQGAWQATSPEAQAGARPTMEEQQLTQPAGLLQREPQQLQAEPHRELPSGVEEKAGAPTAEAEAPVEERKERVLPVTISPQETSTAAVEHQRKMVVCKYLYVLRLYRVLVSSAEFMVKQTARVAQLRKLVRPGSRQAEHLSPLHRLRAETLYRSSYGRLERALIAFDRTRLALSWLLRNYELSCATFKVNATLAHLKHTYARLSQLPRKDKRELATASLESQLSEVSVLLHWFERRHLQLLLEQQANERDSLSIGLIYMDRDLTGTVGPSEVPMLPVKLFSVLDQRRKGEVTTADLQQCLHKLCTLLEQRQAQRHRLQEDNSRLSAREAAAPSDADRAALERNLLEVDKLDELIAADKDALCGIYCAFHSSLREHLFSPPSGARPLDVRHATVPMPLLHALLEGVEHEASTHLLEQELNLGISKLTVAPGKHGEAPAAAQEKEKQLPPQGERRAEWRWQTAAVHEGAAPRRLSAQEERKTEVPSKDVSALGGGAGGGGLSGSGSEALTKGGELAAQEQRLPLHEEATPGKPTVLTSGTAAQAPSVTSVGERIKETFTGGPSDEPLPAAPKESAAPLTEEKPSAIEQLGEKVKHALGMAD